MSIGPMSAGRAELAAAVVDVLLGLHEMPSAYDLHCLIYERFAAAGQAREFLYAPVRLGTQAAVLVRGALTGPAATRSRPLVLPTFGTRWRFLLRANPTVKRDDAHAQISLQAEKDSLRQRWIERRAAEHGFDLVAQDAMRSEPMWLDRPGGRFRLNVTTYSGVLRVVDADRVGHALVSGIGRARSWGCGLLLLQAEDTEPAWKS